MTSPSPASVRRRVVCAIAVVAVATGCGQPAASPSASAIAPSPGATALATPAATPDQTLAPTSAPTSDPGGPSGPPPALELEVITDGLDAPVDVAVRPGEPDALYVVEQGGRIVVVRDGELRSDPVLDIAAAVTAGGEQGLLGLAFHPDPADDRLFVYYTALDGSQVVSAFTATTGAAATADPASEQRILVMEDRFGNHNGGSLVFGPDGFLYIATGDGGGGGDPLGSGRDLSSPLGKILRIDIDREERGSPYAIPEDNPYAETPGARPQTWVSGLRNPWRIRFDSATGDLWIGDVGQGAWEEIDVAPAGVGGLDFGWNIMEGAHCYEPAEGCDRDGLTLPVTEYGHDLGCSVTGGTVYRGAAWPELVGFYVFADYCSGRFWAIPADAQPTVEPALVLGSDRSISAISADAAGELVVTDRGGELLRVSAPGR